jgi:cysteine dioxygenase
MKILRGQLVETRYTRPTVELNSEKERPLERIKETTYETNEITYMSDNLGLHKISNPDPTVYAVSLHRKLKFGYILGSLLNGFSVYATQCFRLWL